MLDSLDTLIAFVLIMLVVSLLITILVQMSSAALNLRGVNLAQGLKRTFGVIDPKSEEHAKQLANYILKGRYLSDSFLPDWPIFRWWRHAEAVRSREVFDAIQRIALGKEPGTYISTWASIKARCTKGKTPVPDLQNKAVRILQGLGIDSGKITEAQTAIAATGEEAQKKLKEFTAAAEAAYKNFDDWTCTCQERAQQWLTMHTRILTIIFAIIAAFALQLDTVDIFKLVSSNKAARDKLVAQSSAVTSQAEKTLGDSKSVLETAYAAWLEKADPNVKAALGSIKVDSSDTRQKLAGRIGNALASNIDKSAVLKSFDEAMNNTVTDYLNNHAQDYTKIRGDLDKTGFELFPQKEWRWGKRWCDGWTKKHVAGILFSIGLLSLGAPFWYSLLKNLVNLRSQVAQNISTEQKEAKKQPDKGKPKPLPPTVMPAAKP